MDFDSTLCAVFMANMLVFGVLWLINKMTDGELFAPFKADVKVVLNHRPENFSMVTSSVPIKREQRERWAKNHDCCTNCGRDDRPHHARGKCRNCYQAKWIRSPRKRR